MSDFFSDDNALAANGNPYFKPTEVGKDRVRGYLVRKSFRKNDMKSKGQGTEFWQRVYTLLVKEGEEYKAWKPGKDDDAGEFVTVKAGELIDVYGRMLARDPVEGKKCSIIQGIEEAPLGMMVGVLYFEDRDTGQPQKAKILKPFGDPRDVNKEAVTGAAWGDMQENEAEPMA